MKGMRRDDSDLLFNGGGDSLSFAFDNLNMRFMADAHTTSLVAVQEKGNRKLTVRIVEEFFMDYRDYDGSYYDISKLPFRVVGTCTVDKYLVLFGKCLANKNFTNHDGVQLKFKKGEDVIVRLERGDNNVVYGWLLYHGDELDFRTEMPLETLGSIETDIVKKVYFVDGVHGPRSVNVVNPEAGVLANINMGYTLRLDDVLTVTRERSVIGNYPVGKVRFFYTYYNDTYSETAIVDWSPFFDCTLENQGGSPDSTRKTTYAFRVKVANTDRQFKYVRIYMQHFTSPDPLVYTLRYIERPLNDDTVDIVFRYDEPDAMDTDRTYLDIKATNMNFIPYTLAEKDNRMFYGNIKRSLPSIEGIDFEGTAQVQFYDKYIGDEELDIDATYKYKPDRTTFEDSRSNYGYMGFRKDNWYRFGIIAQHESGEWSDVMFVADARCTRTSRTEIEYETSQYWDAMNPDSRYLKPLRSKYYIPSARLNPDDAFYTNMQKLQDLGFKRVKPVCVVPPAAQRTVLTQGLSCPTLYTGKDRLTVTNEGKFAMPSWFFRPQPLFDSGETLPGGTEFEAKYPYTIRKVSDLTIPQNITLNNEWVLNPDFTDERYMNFNNAFREWRHGFSLPPKDRINAELQSSDFSVSDYHYMTPSGSVSPLFSQTSGVNLFGFYSSSSWDNVYFSILNPDAYTIPDTDWPFRVSYACRTVPWHDNFTTGYENTVFVDESFCTLNSPEIDYDFSNSVEPWYTGMDIEIAGYAQVTGSMANVSAQDSTLKLETTDHMIDKDALFDKVTGKCLFNVADSDDVDAEARNCIKGLLSTKKTPSSPFVPLAGPWWLDTMLVSSFALANADGYDHNAARLFPYTDIKDENDNIWHADDDELYSAQDENGDYLIKPGYARFLYRAFADKSIKNKDRIFSWTTTFYGETNKRWKKEKIESSVIGDAMYPYNAVGGGDVKRRPIFFSDHYSTGIDPNTAGAGNTAYDIFAAEWQKLSSIPLTLSTRKFTFDRVNDMYWSRWGLNRRNVDTITAFSDPGVVTIPKDTVEEIGNSLTDPCAALYYGDYRMTFLYYFNPFWKSISLIGGDSNYYNQYEDNIDTDVSRFVRINHPFLFPHNATYAGSQGSNRNWIMDALLLIANTQPFNFMYRNVAMLDEDVYYFNGSEYGCHYYAPGSTNFIGSYFDPYYAHVVYPFMTSTDTPFCGSNDAYRGTQNCRPEYNSSNSCLYSSCTNYTTANHPAHTTYSAYYHSPNLTHELRPEPDLSDIPFVEGTSITRLYSYDCSDNAGSPNITTLSHRTYTLTAAMKWYRGFKRLESTSRADTETLKLISTGVNLDASSISGNLLFSGYLPQFMTHTGLLTNDGDYGQGLTNYNFVTMSRTTGTLPYKVENNDRNASEALWDFVKNDYRQLLELSFKSMPHIVYYNQPESGSLGLMPQLYAETARTDILGTDLSFKPQYYYKEFISETYSVPGYSDYVPQYVEYAMRWMKSAYPHTGHFEPYMFDALAKNTSGQPFWNHNLSNFTEYPSQTEREAIDVWYSVERMVSRDSNGKPLDNSSYWVLPVANMYNRAYLTENPYTQQGISQETWSWKMCGYTVRISDILDNNTRLAYLEGDTYFQRYNCFKTVSKDTMFEYLWNNTDSEQSTAAQGINDVTETASVMIESYLNLDGLYWEYINTIDRDTSPLVHPFWNNSKQINPVYGIQNGLCDEFRQIDESYYNSKLEHYPTMIVWSVQKHDGEDVDSFGIVPVGNRMLVSGECGAINKLLMWGDRVFCLQEHGLSILNWNAQVIQPSTTDSTLSIYLSDSTKLQDVTYVSRTCGTLNKWSVAVGRGGFYWTDETQKGIYGFMNGGEGGAGLISLSESFGFRSWARDNIHTDNCLWTADTYADGGKAFKAHVDTESGDIYWSTGETCLCFSEPIGCFTSFYSYGRTPWKGNWLDRLFSVYTDAKQGEGLWEDQCMLTHNIYGTDVDAHVELLVNPAGQYDKVFNFIEYNAEAYLPSSPESVIPIFNPFTKVSVMNMYQAGDWDIDKQNTSQRFRVWRTAIPREKNPVTHKGTLNRIRGPWCRVKLEHVGTSGHPFNGSVVNEYRDKLYYINVNYTIPEQPVKSTVRG